ncbi:glycosyltransferase family 4 protein [Pedobacter sp. PWIIR3]
MKTIAFITPQLKSGGGNRVFIELANHFAQNEAYDVKIFYPNNSLEVTHYKIHFDVEIIKVGVMATSIKGKLANLYSVYKRLIEFLRESSNAIIIISDPILCMFLGFVPKSYRNRVVRLIQSDDYHIFDDLFLLKYKAVLWIFKAFTKYSFKLNVNHVFVSTFVYRQFLKYSKRKDVECKVINPSVDKEVFNNLSCETEKNLNVCLVGRKHPLKRTSDFITVWNTMMDDSIKKQVKAVYIISTEDLSSLNLGHIQLIKPESDAEIAAVYQSSGIFVSTSLWEGFSLPPLEAMHCGCAVISSSSGGINEYAKDRENCLMYEPGNLMQLKVLLEEMISNNNLRFQLSENALETCNNSSWEYTGSKFAKYINEMGIN